MTNEQTFFLTALSDHLHGRKSTVPEGLDFDSLYSLAKKQQLCGILYAQTKADVFERSFYTEILHAVNRQRLLADIHCAFTKNDIPYILIKGTEIARFYPQPELRTMTDSDILVHYEHKEKAHKLLLSLGFSFDNDWGYWKEGLHFELHDRLLYDEAVNLDSLKAWTGHVWEYARPEDGTRYAVSGEFHLVFLLLHLRKHFLNSGVGFRQFMDVAVMSQQSLDWGCVSSFISELNLESFAETCFGLCRVWFQVETPLAGTLPEDFVSKAANQIFAGGVFGFSDEKNRGNQVKYQLESQNSFSIFFKKIFAPYSALCYSKKYSFLEGRPYLLPLAWVYRVFLAIKEKRVSSTAQRVLLPLVVKRDDERAEWLRQWGLSPIEGEKN